MPCALWVKRDEARPEAVPAAGDCDALRVSGGEGVAQGEDTGVAVLG